MAEAPGHVGAHPASAVLRDGQRSWSAAELQTEVGRFAALLRARATRVLATLMDNSPAWVAADLGAAESGVIHVPLPLFFSRGQVGHALQAAGVDTLLVAPAFALSWPAAAQQRVDVAGQALVLVTLPARPVALPAGTSKITFTSGTTGTPKGVCLDAGALRRLALGLVQALEPLDIHRHLCALPLSVLLENVAGMMAPLSRGTLCIVPPLEQVGLSGSSGFDPARWHAAVAAHAPDSVILLPQMLRAWVGHLMQGGLRAPASLKLVAVGGAAVGAGLIHAAQAVGIPAFEGYGLSEGGSVQTLNLPGASRPGSAGRPLPHARVRIAADGEIEIAGSLFAGYLGDDRPPPAWWPTGDLGRIDADGFVYVEGRKKNVLVTAFGRNVSPEWVESALCEEAALAQAVVFGDAQPALSAVVWPAGANATDTALQAAIDRCNAGLPDYARVQRWVRARGPFDAGSGFATANGRAQRAAVWQAHAEMLNPALLETP